MLYLLPQKPFQGVLLNHSGLGLPENPSANNYKRYRTYEVTVVRHLMTAALRKNLENRLLNLMEVIRVEYWCSLCRPTLFIHTEAI